jgi:hypothetical protein
MLPPKAEMHSLHPLAPLKSPLYKGNNVLMQYEVKRVNFEDQKWNTEEARTNHPQLAHHPTNLHHRPLTQNTLQHTITYQFCRDSSCVCI